MVITGCSYETYDGYVRTQPGIQVRRDLAKEAINGEGTTWWEGIPFSNEGKYPRTAKEYFAYPFVSISGAFRKMEKAGYFVINFDRTDHKREIRGEREIVDYDLHCDLLPAQTRPNAPIVDKIKGKSERIT